MSKRIADLIVATLLAIPAALICAVAMLFVYLDLRASPLFTQRRVGLHQRHFTLVKMRTMPVSTPDRPSHEVGEISITATGRILRRFKIDELPQLWCVLRGEMSLVGPRPCLPSQTQLIAERAKHGAFEVRPGITGPAQIRGLDMSKPTELAEVDGRYAANNNLIGDILILIRTVLGGGRGDAAG